MSSMSVQDYAPDCTSQPGLLNYYASVYPRSLCYQSLCPAYVVIMIWHLQHILCMMVRAQWPQGVMSSIIGVNFPG